jgi:hypothetical protein
MRNEPEPINPQMVPEAELPQEEGTRQAIFAQKILIAQNKEKELVAYDPHAPSLFPRLIPLRQAILVEGDYGYKYPTLLDRRALPTSEERQQSPAMFCHTVMSARLHLNPTEAASELLRTFDTKEYPHQPAQTPNLQAAVGHLQATVKAAHIIHDKRLRPVLQALVDQILLVHLPTTSEEIKAQIPEKAHALYYYLRFALRRAQVLLHWYEASTLYVIKEVSYEGNSVGDKHIVVGSDLHRTEVELSASYVWNRHTSPHLDRWELYANDHLLRTVRRDEQYDDLYTLSAEWNNRTDEETSNWIV